MNRRETTTEKVDACVDFTTKQKEQLELAAALDHVYVDSPDDPFSLILLEAVKQNSNIQKVSVRAAKNPQREFLDSLASVVVSHPSIAHLSFHGDHSDENSKGSVGDDCARDNYTTLISAMAGSQSLEQISLSRYLPLELEEAVMVCLKRKSTLTTLYLFDSRLIINNPTGFGEMLANSKGLGCLHLSGIMTLPRDRFDGTDVRDGLGKNQTLKEIKVWGGKHCSYWIYPCILKGLEGNQSLEKLGLSDPLNSSEALLLIKLVSTNESLACLDASVSPDEVDALCEAVSYSRSMTELTIDPQSCISSISRMLHQTSSLQKLHLKGGNKHSDMVELAIGLQACKTLTTLSVLSWTFDEVGTRTFLGVVLENHNLSEINSLPGKYRQRAIVNWNQAQRHKLPELELLLMELYFYLAFNKQGRELLRTGLPAPVWPHALKMAGNSAHPDALYFFLRQAPELVLYRYQSVQP